MKKGARGSWASILAGLLSGAVVFCTAATAAAEETPKPYPECTKTPTDEELNAAKGAFNAGNVAFKEADYARAVLYWEDAYRRDCTANALLLNLARAYELNGQKQHAVLALESFLKREPNTQEKDQIQRRIEVLQQSIEQEKQPVETTRPSTAAAESKPATPPPSTTTQSVSEKKPLLPLVVAGVGGAALIGGGVLFFVGGSKVGDVDDQCFGGTDCRRTQNNLPRSYEEAAKLKDEGNSARGMQVVGGVVAGVGAAALISGLTWYALAPSKHSDSATSKARPRITPVVSSAVLGVSLTSAF